MGRRLANRLSRRCLDRLVLCLTNYLKIMNYTGKLYGKGHGRTYFPLVLTSEDVDRMQEENRQLKDMLATLLKTHATDIQRLSDMIDRRDKAGREIIEAARHSLPRKHPTIERNAPIFIPENDKVEARDK